MMTWEMEMESHGGVSTMKRLTQLRNFVPTIVALALSARGEPQSRTRWLNKLRPAGASHRRKGQRAR